MFTTQFGRRNDRQKEDRGCNFDFLGQDIPDCLLIGSLAEGLP